MFSYSTSISTLPVISLERAQNVKTPNARIFNVSHLIQFNEVPPNSLFCFFLALERET